MATSLSYFRVAKAVFRGRRFGVSAFRRFGVSAFGVRRSAFGVRRSAFGVRRSAFGVRRSAFGVRRSAFGVRRSAFGLRPPCAPPVQRGERASRLRRMVPFSQAAE
ncbi:hypothetical protein AQ718_03090 [Burkholderia pseudomallei]|nr:hypothetical protein AQ718_03090 [Burkholderia pseudomallei]